MQNATSSAYLLIFRDAGPDSYKSLSPEERQQLLTQWNAWYDGLASAGKLQQGHPLEPKGRIVSGPNGVRVVDGPFAESKEAVGGFFYLTVDSLDEATDIARQCPSLRLDLGISIEVRPVAECCPHLHGSREAEGAALAHA